MKDLYNNNMDVAIARKPKIRNRIFPSRDTHPSDKLQTISSSFRHPSERVMDSLQRFLRYNGPTPNIDVYTENLKAGISRYCGLSENNIHILPETERAVQTIIKTFVTPDDSVLMCRPLDNDKILKGISENINIRYHDGVTPFMADPKGIIEAITDSTRLIYLANPNLCTGTIYGIDEIETIIDRTSNVKIVLDETYYEYYGTSLAGLISQYDNLIVVRSFSAAFGLGELPCSYILASPENITALKRLSPGNNVSALSIVAAAAVLSDFDYLKKQVNTVRENMTYLSVRLRGLGIGVRTTPADFILVEVADPLRVISELSAAGIKANSINKDDRFRNYISVPVIDDTYSTNVVDAFMNMPRAFYLRKQTGKKLILHRPGENKLESAEVGKMSRV